LSSFEKSRYQELTERELQIIRLVLSGLMNYQIAERLGLSERTVQVHRANTYRKLGVRTVAELARFMERAQEWT
jgi:DNA-binding NarL/FixJ family response regulator